MAKKYYAIRKGHKVGIFTDNWSTVQTYIKGYPKAEYKGFNSLDEAESFMKNGNSSINTSKKGKNKGTWDENTFDYSGIVCFTDGSVKYADSDRTKDPISTSYGLVVLEDGEVVKLDAACHSDELNKYRNVTGEIKAVISALLYANKNKVKKMKICFDYIGIALWIDSFGGQNQWRAKNKLSQNYVDVFYKLTRDIDVEFVKVPAHSNVKYNELADTLANSIFKDDLLLKELREEYGCD